ncbi:MAG: glycosyltransferase family 4 protein [Coleofasciculus sp. C1-SOL-03]|uniref:glycosyltransferase family 4 protein n=1 Tax=Coleofasciculus sp. C1-SOL-03 TaxID=3069522 RepID=UPI0032F42972
MDKIKVFIVCSGLGRIQRGFESFTQECFEALSKVKYIDITLFKGGGQSNAKEMTLWNLPRHSWLAMQFGQMTRRGAYYIEQASFALSLLPHLYRQQPDVIYYSDGTVGNVLWHWRRFTKQSYKLLFSNGAPFFPPLLPYYDHLQQVAPSHLQVALDRGVPAAKQTLIPYGVKIPAELKLLSFPERETLRRQLRLPQKRQIILSVGAINKSHKRMDYLIREIGTLSEPRPYLLLLGQQESQSPEILQLGNQLLGTDNFQVRTVASHQVADYYRVADAFVLASLTEGFGRVFLEAMSYGLPCLAHDYEVARFVLGKEGYFANFELPGSLADLIYKVLVEVHDESKCYLRHRSVYDRFSWKKLLSSYSDMIQYVACKKIG